MKRIRLAPNRKHSISFENVDELVHITGKVDCVGCQNTVDQLPTEEKILILKAQNVARFSVENIKASLPVRLTVRDSLIFKATRSYFANIPWPGFYVYNVSSVLLKANTFGSVAPKSIVIKTGNNLVISHNILDVSSTMDITKFFHVTMLCNVPNPDTPPIEGADVCDLNLGLNPQKRDFSSRNWVAGTLFC